MERKRDFRPTYDIDSSEPTSQNYYPVNSHIYIKDDLQQMGVIVDRSQGGSSMQDGCIELMLHRRLLDDDAKGVGEALNERAFGTGLVATGKHTLLLGEDITKQRKKKTMEMFYKPMLLFEESSETRNTNLIPELELNLPENVNILTLTKILQPSDPDSTFLLLRLEHFYQVGEDSELSQAANVSLQDLFSQLFEIETIQETSLGGHQWLDEVNRLTWRKGRVLGNHASIKNSIESKDQDGEITLFP